MASYSRESICLKIKTLVPEAQHKRFNMPQIAIIVAIAQNNAIGYKNKLLYYLPNDLKHFKAITTGNTIIMGRKTFESLPKGALPNRRNIVLTHNQDLSFEGAEHFSSLQEALKTCREQEKVFIIGGASVYAEALPLAQILHLTYIQATPEHADAFFPEIDLTGWKETRREEHSTDEKHHQPYIFVDYEQNKR